MKVEKVVALVENTEATTFFSVVRYDEGVNVVIQKFNLDAK